jgi:AcrR family transcriptional regulator
MTRERLSRQQSRLQTRDRLLEASSAVFSRCGFHAASVEEIAEEAGYSKGAVYSNFASKEELFLTLLDRHLETELQSITAQFTPKEEHEGERVSEQDRSFPVHLEERRTWNVLTLEFFLYALRHPTAQQQLAERYRGARQILTTLFQGISQAEKDRSAVPIEYLPWVLIALGTGLSLQAYLEPGALPTDLYSTIIGRLLDTPHE